MQADGMADQVKLIKYNCLVHRAQSMTKFQVRQTMHMYYNVDMHYMHTCNDRSCLVAKSYLHVDYACIHSYHGEARINITLD